MSHLARVSSFQISATFDAEGFAACLLFTSIKDSLADFLLPSFLSFPSSSDLSSAPASAYEFTNQVPSDSSASFFFLPPLSLFPRGDVRLSSRKLKGPGSVTKL